MTSSADAMRQLFEPSLGRLDTGGSNLEPQMAIYPDQMAPVVVGGSGADTRYRLETMRWGWPPFGDVKRPITNVRNLESPFWTSALTRPHQRCLVPVTAFCEWSAQPAPKTGRKRQHWFGLKDREAFAFAGIWRPDGDNAHFAFLTCEANSLVGAVHPKAMPVVLIDGGMKQWLTGDLATVRSLARPFPAEDMEQLS